MFFSISLFPLSRAAALLSLAFSLHGYGAELNPAKVLQRIAFGSCASEDKPQPIWDEICAVRPDLFLAAGDNIYGDTTDMELLKAKYKELGAKPGFQRLRQQCPVLATWDDHDYGVNDGGAGYSRKKESQQVMLDFYQEPADSPRRHREGIYDAKRFGPPGQCVQIILLDLRYFRSRPRKDSRSEEEKKRLNVVGWYVPDTEPTSGSTILGDRQWQWLEEQLRLPADLRLVVSSFQVIASEKGMESWGNFPSERRRLYQLIGTTGARGVVFLSGDVHFSEISRTLEGPYPLYDFTSSGLTNSHPGWAAAINPHRTSPIAYAEPTFGLVEIDWQVNPPSVRLSARGLKGITAFTQTLALPELQAKR